MLLDLKQRGLTKPRKLAVDDGALGFWSALREVYRTTREQRCWVHKTVNVLNKMPPALPAKAKSDLHQIWLAETRGAAIKAFDPFLEKYGAKVEAAYSRLSKHRDALLAFYDFSAEQWGHLRTTNLIESNFATIRFRHRRKKGSSSRKASLTMIFKLAQLASRRWRRLKRITRSFLFSKEESSPTELCRTPPESGLTNTTFNNSCGTANRWRCSFHHSCVVCWLAAILRTRLGCIAR
ncbi:MAG: hypothetical protein EXS09_22645 [Gemmataceae bacterium]|nr:hypothetical protein [Gemmataceae bacterium]